MNTYPGYPPESKFVTGFSFLYMGGGEYQESRGKNCLSLKVSAIFHMSCLIFGVSTFIPDMTFAISLFSFITFMYKANQF